MAESPPCQVFTRKLCGFHTCTRNSLPEPIALCCTCTLRTARVPPPCRTPRTDPVGGGICSPLGRETLAIASARSPRISSAQPSTIRDHQDSSRQVPDAKPGTKPQHSTTGFARNGSGPKSTSTPRRLSVNVRRGNCGSRNVACHGPHPTLLPPERRVSWECSASGSTHRSIAQAGRRWSGSARTLAVSANPPAPQANRNNHLAEPALPDGAQAQHRGQSHSSEAS